MPKDKCVICGQESPYDENTHISRRRGYIEGVGQTCFGNCGVHVPTTIIKNTPNNMELGEKVRDLYWETKDVDGFAEQN